jgi:hypothetical protein
LFSVDVDKYAEEDMMMETTADSSMMSTMMQSLYIDSTLDLDWDSFWQ